MKMKVVTATSATEATEAVIELVEQIELPPPSLFVIGVAVLTMAANATASKSEEFREMAKGAMDERLPTEENLLILAHTYLEYVKKRRSEGHCVCGDPECKNNKAKESSESSTSIH